MKKNLLIITVLILCTAAYTLITNRSVFMGAADAPAAPGIVKAGHPTPDFSFTDINGANKKLSAYQGKVIILNFWASWCTPCVVEFPALLNLAAEFPDNVVLVALSADFEEDAMNRFLTRLKKENGQKATASNVIIARDANQSIIQPIFQTVRLPETILIGPDFIMRDKIIGATEWDGPAMRATIAGFISENP